MNRTVFYIIICFFWLAENYFAQWVWQNPKPQSNRLTSIHFSDDLNGWAVGEFGTIIHTKDGGENWDLQESRVKENLW